MVRLWQDGPGSPESRGRNPAKARHFRSHKPEAGVAGDPLGKKAGRALDNLGGTRYYKTWPFPFGSMRPVHRRRRPNVLATELGEKAAMIEAARDKFSVGPRHTSNAGQVWGSTMLIAVEVWTLAMILSLRERFLDRFVNGASHGLIGLDFFSTPRGFRNLISGSNIYLTELDNYGPYATTFFTHPILAAAVGSWTSVLAPWNAYGAFVGVSLALLATGAGAIACQFEGRLLRAFTLFALFCSLPTYLMLWNAQMHVWLVLAAALMLGGLVGMERDEQGSTRSLRMVQIGLLVSLLSKPLALLTLPVLFAARETRRALILPLAAYATISALFLLMPELNSGGYNGIHWLNLINASSSPNSSYSLVFTEEFELDENTEIYCLPMYLCRLTGAPVSTLLLKLPVLAILAMSTLPLFLASRRRRIHVTIATFMLSLLSYFLCCYPVYEYHYAMLLPTLPVLWWMSQGEERAELRWLLRIAFVVLLANFLPTPYFLAPRTPMRYLTASTLLRVVPVVIAFVSLLLYCVGNGRAALEEGSDGVVSPRGQMPDLVRIGAALTILAGVVLASVLLSVPDRLLKPLDQWNSNDWSMHVTDLLARPHPGLKPIDLASMHCVVARQCFDTNPRIALEHYAAADELTPEQPDLLCEIADRLVLVGKVELAISMYQRVLELEPDHQVAQARLRIVRDRSRRETQ